MNKAPCQICTRPTDGFACKHCATAARLHLVRLAELLTDVDTARARVKAVVYDRPSVGGFHHHGMSYDARITPHLDAVRNHLTTLARDIHEHDPAIAAADLLEDVSLPQLALKLTRHSDWLRMQQQGPETFEATRICTERLAHLFDAAPELLVLGECRQEFADGSECPAIVYVEASNPLPSYTRCPACQMQHDVHARRDEILGLALDMVGTAREISGLLCTMTGRRLSPDAIRGLDKRGTIHAVSAVHERDRLGRGRLVKTYRLGSVIAATQAHKSAA